MSTIILKSNSPEIIKPLIKSAIEKIKEDNRKLYKDNKRKN